MDMSMMQEQMQKGMQQLQGMHFPASKQDLVTWATEHGASNDQAEMIKKLPKDNFNSIDDVKSAAKSMMKMG